MRSSQPQQSSLRISEIYETIQGESTFAGVPCLMIRTVGCPMRCSWCDTEQAFHGGERMSLDAIMKKVEASALPLIEITGGEPLAQLQTVQLMERILAYWQLNRVKGDLLLETGGFYSIEHVPDEVITILDLKCPASGEAERNDWGNFRRLRGHDQIKCVVADRNDFDWAKTKLAGMGVDGNHVVIYSPVHGHLDPAILASWVRKEQPLARMQMQLHKYIWPNQHMGV